ncbi:unnamed protein product [Rangifer tarandus platyrhynchus]|uniref:Uncharacterized protein n=1 Tax=Rangifer tarandus platyrhynchus TaxID=3082113 RepID=A0ABN8ZTQ6_RANTA|nr:unnamed protein product [Rangifer tarandus platyrhynchus]
MEDPWGPGEDPEDSRRTPEDLQRTPGDPGRTPRVRGGPLRTRGRPLRTRGGPRGPGEDPWGPEEDPWGPTEDPEDPGRTPRTRGGGGHLRAPGPALRHPALGHPASGPLRKWRSAASVPVWGTLPRSGGCPVTGEKPKAAEAIRNAPRLTRLVSGWGGEPDPHSVPQLFPPSSWEEGALSSLPAPAIPVRKGPGLRRGCGQGLPRPRPRGGGAAGGTLGTREPPPASSAQLTSGVQPSTQAPFPDHLPDPQPCGPRLCLHRRSIRLGPPHSCPAPAPGAGTAGEPGAPLKRAWHMVCQDRETCVIRSRGLGGRAWARSREARGSAFSPRCCGQNSL